MLQSVEGVCYEWAKKADGSFWRKEVEGFLELILFLKKNKNFGRKVKTLLVLNLKVSVITRFTSGSTH